MGVIRGMYEIRSFNRWYSAFYLWLHSYLSKQMLGHSSYWRRHVCHIRKFQSEVSHIYA